VIYKCFLYEFIHNLRKVKNCFVLAALRYLPQRLPSNPSLTDRWRDHIRSIHYCKPLPDFRKINTAPTTRRRLPPSNDFVLAGQVALIDRFASLYRGELKILAATRYTEEAYFNNDYFAGLDAAVYSPLIRGPMRTLVPEIGSAHATRMTD
jgi:hypothetical protein